MELRFISLTKLDICVLYDQGKSFRGLLWGGRLRVDGYGVERGANKDDCFRALEFLVTNEGSTQNKQSSASLDEPVGLAGRTVVELTCRARVQ